MKRTFTLFQSFFFILIANILFAQSPAIEWQKCLGGGYGDYAHSIEPTSDGGYIVAGYSGSNDGDISGHHGSLNVNDFCVMKLSNTGAIQWQKSLGGSGEDRASAIHQTPDGGYIVAGSAGSNDGDVAPHIGFSMDFWLVKLSSTGSIQWQKSMGGSLNEYCYSVELTNDGGYILAGMTESNDRDVSGNNGLRDYWIVKVNSLGNMQWQKCLGGSNDDEAMSVKQTTDGGYIVTGVSQSNDGNVTGHHGNSDHWVVKLNNVGSIQWQKSLGGSDLDWGWAIEQTTDGGYVEAGASRSVDGDITGHHSTAGGEDFWMVKLSSTGNIQWQKSLGGTFADLSYCIKTTTDGGYIIAGSSESEDGDVTCHIMYSDFWVVKLNSSGIIEWEKIMGGNSIDEIYSVQPTSDGGYILAGLTASSNISGYHPNLTSEAGDFLIVKLSNQIITPAIPAITINPPPANICSSSIVTLTTSVNPVANNPNYQWKKNGINVGPNNNSYTASNFSNGDIITCLLTYTGPCNSVATVLSNAVVMNVGNGVTASLSISASDNDVCKGTAITFTAMAVNAGTTPSFQWKLNNTNVGSNSTMFSSNILSNGDQIFCELVPGNDACSNSIASSNTIPISINDLPGINITPFDTIIPVGSQIQLNAAVTGNIGSYQYQWAPANQLENPFSLLPTTTHLTSNTTYTLNVVSNKGCTTSKNITVKIFMPLLYMPNGFTPNGDGLNDVFRIPQDVSLLLDEFSIYDRWGIKIFTTRNIHEAWNGTYKGSLAIPGVYIYIIKGSNEKGAIFSKGSFVLIR